MRLRLFIHLLLPLLLPTTLASALAAQTAKLPDDGLPAKGRFTLAAEGAWIRPDLHIQPAFVVIENGQVAWVGRRQPRRTGRLYQIEGSLAPGLVDAWNGVRPNELRSSRQFPGQLNMADQLPPDFAGADSEWARLLIESQQAGVAAQFFSSGGSSLQRGVGTAVSFAPSGMPVAAGDEALEFVLGSARQRGPAALSSLTGLSDLFDAAQAHRDAQEEYKEKLEKYEKDLEEYDKKLQEYIDKKEKEEKADGNGGGDSSKRSKAGNGKDGPGGKGGDGKKDGDKKKKPPARPKRPKAPKEDPVKDLHLKALDGLLPVRVEANGLSDIQGLLNLKQNHPALAITLLGGRDADLLAKELAEAEIAVVLGAWSPGVDAGAGRPLADRFRRLQEAKVTVALGSGGGFRAQAFLLDRAASLVAAGIPLQEVWASLTTVPAEILGLPNHGRLGQGTDAHLLLFEGRSPFDASAPMRPLQAGNTLQ
ncbi:MAG: hypothetical protein DWQ01_20215 [Planctomycetota bacterium]|nr:MAG: hypothetical protein DWQ01_20215 [Planctomycetota bacterium]